MPNLLMAEDSLPCWVAKDRFLLHCNLRLAKRDSFFLVSYALLYILIKTSGLEF